MTEFWGASALGLAVFGATVGATGAHACNNGIPTTAADPNPPARISSCRRVSAADATGVPLYLNARTDIYLLGIGAPDARLAATLERAAAYREAGADGIFVPGTTDPDTVAALVKGIAAPLNILAGPGAPTIAELAAVGVARVSIGFQAVRRRVRGGPARG